MRKSSNWQFSPNFRDAMPYWKNYASDPGTFEGWEMAGHTACKVRWGAVDAWRQETKNEGVFMLQKWTRHWHVSAEGSDRSMLYSGAVYRTILMQCSLFLEEETFFQMLYTGLNCIASWYQYFSLNSAKKIQKFSKPGRKVCAHNFDHLEPP